MPQVDLQKKGHRTSMRAAINVLHHGFRNNRLVLEVDFLKKRSSPVNRCVHGCFASRFK